jgi:5-(carboxyamino)imidazole ribonucleotide synthase
VAASWAACWPWRAPAGHELRFPRPGAGRLRRALGEHLRADYGDQDHLRQLADEVDLVTFEFESVPAKPWPSCRSSCRCTRAPKPCASPATACSRRACSGPGHPDPGLRRHPSQADLDAAVASIGLPAVLKTRTLGYDGKGQKVLRKPEDVVDTFAELGSVPCLLEGFVPFTGEVSLVAVRARDGETRFYPLVHNTHDSGILRLSVASERTRCRPGRRLRRPRAAKLDYVGVMAFEFFEVDGGLKANEIAPACTTPGTGPSKAPSAASSRTTCAPWPACRWARPPRSARAPCSTSSAKCRRWTRCRHRRLPPAPLRQGLQGRAQGWPRHPALRRHGHARAKIAEVEALIAADRTSASGPSEMATSQSAV